MDDAKRHRREMEATLAQIRERQISGRATTGTGGKQPAGRPPLRWRLDISCWRLAIEGICVFVLGILVGLGIYVLYELSVSSG